MNIFLMYHLASKVTKEYLLKNKPLLVNQDDGVKIPSNHTGSSVAVESIKTTSVDTSGVQVEKSRKKYSRFALYKLPECKDEDASVTLVQSLLSRRTSYNFSKSFTKEALSSLLYYSVGLKKNSGTQKRRMYPSGGAKYPVEPYLFLFKSVDDIPAGIFHYDEDEHGLRLMRKMPSDEWKLYTLTAYAFAQETNAAFIMTAIFERTQIKYGERAYRYVMLEVGGIAQNICLVATSLGYPAVQMGGLIEETVEELLDIDGSVESVVHSVFL